MDEETKQLQDNGESSLAELFEGYHDRLERMIAFRLDERLRGRVDAEDILQEAYIELARRLGDYLASPAVSVYVWMRQITYQCLIGVQRRHFGQKRDPRHEVTAHYASASNQEDATSLSILSAFAEQATSPSQALVRQEEIEQLRDMLAGMDEVDREVLALRHFEHLSNNQIAEALGISITAASNRYVRAMLRLSQLGKHPS